MFRGNSDACVSAIVAILTIKKTTLITSFYLIVFKGNRSAYNSCFKHSLHSPMASAFITYSYQINFESVLMIHDHEGMLNMFKALEASGLRRFLGCESVLYEKKLGHFFDTAIIQDEDITGVISGKFVSISPNLFAKVAEESKGLCCTNRCIIEGYSYYTMGDGVPFPSAKILSMRTVHTYIVTNTTIDARAESEEPGMAKTPKAKKKTSSVDEMPVDIFTEFTASKKRSATEADAPIITKKRRTGKSKPSVSQRMTNRRMEEPVARGMVLRRDKAAAGSDTRVSNGVV
ncbi:alpha/beta hydrolase domain-containing protein 17B-like [Dorcoceras hygrometricum]|uniref:Alpha/beta hydrolase domain-containing protein 17B-like n=1 Tax=Dorcoceras hygrometricum TaxID=472368 RepID=A0A2Z7A449_9LAMI|nr:alpha/beta hydrolase domain-containing protein 17B-like [Dorcoceras hygrometricum]